MRTGPTDITGLGVGDTAIVTFTLSNVGVGVGDTLGTELGAAVTLTEGVGELVTSLTVFEGPMTSCRTNTNTNIPALMTAMAAEPITV